MINNRKTVLLFGMPRSGTTWIGKIFDSHPGTLYMHEPDSWGRMDFLPLFVDRKVGSAIKDKIRQYHAELPTVCTHQVTTKLPVFRKNYQTSVRFYQYKASVHITSTLRKLGIGSKLKPMERIGKEDLPFILVWKSIESLGRLACLASNITNSFGIHIVRNPAGYIASVLNGERKNNFREMLPTSEDYPLFEMLLSTRAGLGLGITVSDLKAMGPIERLAIRWRLYNEIAYGVSKDMDNYRLVRYEDVCRDPVGLTRMLFKYCDIDLTEQTLRFVNSSTTRQRDSYYSVFKDPIKAAYHWKETLPEVDINKIETTLKSSVAFSWYQDDFSRSRI